MWLLMVVFLGHTKSSCNLLEIKVTDQNNEVRSYTLTEQIRKKIRNRILLSITLFFLIIIVISFYDIEKSFRNIEKEIDEKSQSLADYVISQILVGDKEAIKIKLEEENKGYIKYQWIQDNYRHSPYKKMRWVFPFSWEYLLPLHSINKIDFGYFLVSGKFLDNKQMIYELIGKMILLLLFGTITGILIYPLGNRIPRYLFIEPIMNILLLLKGNSNDIVKEDKMIAQEIKEIKGKIFHLIQEREERSRLTAFMQIAAQVAHDIRSPLAALEIVIKDIQFIPEDQRILIRNATSRIHDIANNLLSQYIKKDSIHSDRLLLKNTNELVSDLLHSVVSEKRAQYRNKPVEFTMEIQKSGYGIFATLSVSEFKRIISNLINNAVESACGNKITVKIALSAQDKFLTVRITDNGSGIPSELLPKIIAEKISTKNENGHGLGLSHAIKTIKDLFGGQFNIQSQIGKGTEIDIVLPASPKPTWFVSELAISPQCIIVILDDDQSIHEVWRKRFEEIDANIQFIDFYNSNEFIEWYKLHLPKEVYFLVDYELIGCEMTGLDAIFQLGISSTSYLVTSRYEDIEIRHRCEQVGLRIIPKSFAPHIFICIKKEDDFFVDLIFIDDDPVLTDAWNFQSKKSGKRIATFNCINDFKAVMDNYNKNTPIYIDSNLNDCMSGQVFAKELYHGGFTNLYLATGYNIADFDDISHIKSVVGKEPPF
jgi:signal transduction histidine kinase